jgi:MYXO-CTERM domain-containing protein
MMSFREARSVILSRRAKFLAAGLAAAGVVAMRAGTVAADASVDSGSEDASTDAAGAEPEAIVRACLCACEAPGTSASSEGALPLAATLAAGALRARRRKPRSPL